MVEESKHQTASGNRFLFSILTALLFVFFIVLVDVLIGIFFPYNRPARPRNDTTFVVSSPTRVHQFIPNSRFVYDGAAYQTNSLGFRDVEYSQTKPNGAVRLAVLGDSFIEGMGEHQEDTIPKQLERIWNGKADERAQVMNCGVRGGSPASYKFWMRALLAYEPDAFIVCVYDNDIDDDASTLLKKAYYRADAYWHHSTPFWRKSNLFSYVQGEMANLRFKIQRKALSRALYNQDDFVRENKRSDGDANGIGSNSIGYTVQPEKWRPHWERTKENLNEIRDVAQQHQIPVIVVYIPGMGMFPSRPSSLEFKRNYFSEWVEAWAMQAGVPCVNLQPLVAKWHKNPLNPSPYQSTYQHFNPIGLKIAAEEIAKKMNLKSLRKHATK